MPLHDSILLVDQHSFWAQFDLTIMEDIPVLLKVSVISRWDLYARVSRIEETMFTREDAKEMQKTTERTEKEEMEKKVECLFDEIMTSGTTVFSWK